MKDNWPIGSNSSYNYQTPNKKNIAQLKKGTIHGHQAEPLTLTSG